MYRQGVRIRKAAERSPLTVVSAPASFARLCLFSSCLFSSFLPTIKPDFVQKSAGPTVQSDRCFFCFAKGSAGGVKGAGPLPLRRKNAAASPYISTNSPFSAAPVRRSFS